MKTLRYKTEVLSCVAHFLVDLTCTACLGRLSSRLSYDSIIACAIFFTLWLVYTIFLFRRRIFKKKYANKPVPVWEDQE